MTIELDVLCAVRDEIAKKLVVDGYDVHVLDPMNQGQNGKFRTHPADLAIKLSGRTIHNHQWLTFQFRMDGDKGVRIKLMNGTNQSWFFDPADPKVVSRAYDRIVRMAEIFSMDTKWDDTTVV